VFRICKKLFRNFAAPSAEGATTDPAHGKAVGKLAEQEGAPLGAGTSAANVPSRKRIVFGRGKIEVRKTAV
jgi:hypothetical protein